jgi:hypothetical protein
MKFFFFSLRMFYISKYEQDVRMFMYHRTKYELNYLVKQRDDIVEGHRIHRLLMHHDVFPSLKFLR